MVKNLKNVLLNAVLAAFALLLPAVAAMGQNASGKVRVTGTVVDEVGPVIGATVTVNGNAKLGGTMTDAKGEFSFDVPKGATLVVSCIGYASAEKVITGPTNWFVTLSEDSEMLEDVVVVGYGVQKKESVVGSISQVTSEALVNSGTTNISNAIAGKLAGVVTYQSTGQPGNNDATIFVRGLSSWNGSTPLIMVDGVERSFTELDPNEVESISVLKDASATAVFGAKGANGVILVTTKTGLKGAPKMKLSVDYGISTPEKLPEHVPAATIAEYANTAFKNEQNFASQFSDEILQAYRDQTNPLRYPDNDWFNMLVKNIGQTLNANYSVSGGSDKVKYFVSLGYTNEGSNVKQIASWSNAGFDYHKLNYRSNLDFTLTKSTTLSLKVGGSTEIEQHPTETSVANLFTNMYNASPMMFPAYFNESALELIPDTDYPDASGIRLSDSNGSYASNPYSLLANGDFQQTTTNRLNTDLTLNQKLNFITKGLSLKATVSLTSSWAKYSQEGSTAYPTYRIDWDAYENGGSNPWVTSASSNYVYVDVPISITQDGTARSTNQIFYWETSLNYARKFKNAHNVTAMVLFNQKQKNSGASFPRRAQGTAGRVTYDYKGKYLLEGNLGITGSEQFAPEYRYGVFPSWAVGYIVSKERFWKSAMPWWSTMKLRYSDGIVGSDAAGEDWLYYSSYSKSDGNIIEQKSANVTARWETAHKRDAGIELGWMKDALTLNVDLYDEQRYDMLVTPQNITPFVGIAYKDVNTGRMKKHGFDVELKYRNTTAKGFYWEVGGMLGMNENRILNYEDPPYTPEYQKIAGKPYKAQSNGMNSIGNGYFNTIDEIHGYPSTLTVWNYVYPGILKLLDYNGDGLITTTDMHAIEGNAYSPVTYSFSAAFGYKRFNFRMLWYGNEGKYIDFNRGYLKEFIKGDYTMHMAQLDAWTPDHHDATHTTPSINDSFYSSFGGSGTGSGYTMALDGHSWRQSDFLTLKEIYLSYKFDGNKLYKTMGVKGLSITATANNLLTFSNLVEGNPQRTSLSSSYYPLMRTVKLGVKLDF